MPVRLLECHLGDGIFMECRMKKHAVVLIIVALFFVPSILRMYEWNQYKQILFFDYDFGNTENMHQNFFRLGFKYKANFAKCAERKILFDNVEIFYNEYGPDFVILFCYSDRATSMIKAILNRKSLAWEKEMHLPDDFYSYEPSKILEWTFDDRVIYLAEFANVKKLYIGKTGKNSNTGVLPIKRGKITAKIGQVESEKNTIVYLKNYPKMSKKE